MFYFLWNLIIAELQNIFKAIFWLPILFYSYIEEEFSKI